MRRLLLPAADACVVWLRRRESSGADQQHSQPHHHQPERPMAAIVDPYETGLNARFYLNAKPKDKHELVEYDFDKSDVLNVPGDWNTQKKELFFYEGPVWYKKSFSYHKREHTRVFVYFGAANYFTRVYLNGEALGEHEGGFTPFNFEVTDKIHEGDNFLVVEVNNARRRDGVPRSEHRLVELRRTHSRRRAGGGARNLHPGLRSSNSPKDRARKLPAGCNSNGSTSAQQVTVEIPEAGIKQTVDHRCRRPRGVSLSRQA